MSCYEMRNDLKAIGNQVDFIFNQEVAYLRNKRDRAIEMKKSKLADEIDTELDELNSIQDTSDILKSDYVLQFDHAFAQHDLNNGYVMDCYPDDYKPSGIKKIIFNLMLKYHVNYLLYSKDINWEDPEDLAGFVVFVTDNTFSANSRLVDTFYEELDIVPSEALTVLAVPEQDVPSDVTNAQNVQRLTFTMTLDDFMCYYTENLWRLDRRILSGIERRFVDEYDSVCNTYQKYLHESESKQIAISYLFHWLEEHGVINVVFD